jgi:hypothetical protein
VNTVVSVRFVDLGLAAPLGAILAEQDGIRVALVHDGLTEVEAFAALGDLLDNPPSFPLFVQIRAEGGLRNTG